ncbi:MAG: carboxypeptidase regulatory-like domain-containing protein [Verrucomicrobiota bacterium]
MRANSYLLVGLLALLGVGGLRAGSIVGVVKAMAPKPPTDAGGAGGAYDSRRYRFVEKMDYERLKDFVVYIDQPGSDFAPSVLAVQTVKTTQKDANFEPHVLPVVVGSTVRWPNEDDIFHNVFSMSEAKEFDLEYYKKEKIPEVKFDRVGRVDVFCAIHPKMHCIILVLPNPFFAAVDDKGRFAIKNLPAGTYKVRAWHERIPSQVKEIVVPAEGEAKVDFTLGFGELPKK